jgi:chromosome segregation ATPase
VLGAALLYRHSEAVKEMESLQAAKEDLEKELQQKNGELEEQRGVNNRLESDLASRLQQILQSSNRVIGLSAELARTEAEAQAAARTAQDEISRRDSKINELTGQNDELTTQMTGLNVALTDLETQIAETERMLAASEGDREFLLQELKRLQVEKTELERQFNDLALLREQVRKLKDELSIARRLEWIRRGLYGNEQKGTEKLQSGFATPPGTDSVDLDVELRQDGGTRVIPSSTNAPATSSGGP